MDKDTLAFQLLLVLKSCPHMMVSDISLIVRNRLSLDWEGFQSAEEKDCWEIKVRRVCAYLKKLNFIKCNGSKIVLTIKGTEYLNIMYAPIAMTKKGEMESCN